MELLIGTWKKGEVGVSRECIVDVPLKLRVAPEAVVQTSSSLEHNCAVSFESHFPQTTPKRVCCSQISTFAF